MGTDAPAGDTALRTATGLRGLLIGADEASADVLRQLWLDAPGPQVALATCASLEEGGPMLSDGGWDVVLMGLPRASEEIPAALEQATAAAGGVPVLALDADEDDDRAAAATTAGAQDYLVLGAIDEDHLLRAVRYAIERRGAEIALRRSKVRMAAIFEQLPEGVMLLDDEGRLLLINPTARTYLPILQGRDVAVGEILRQLGEFDMQELLDASAEGGWHEVVEDCTIPRTFEVRAGRLSRGPAGNLLLVIRDVSYARDLQRQVDTQQRLGALGELAAGIAHDFNNVLQVVIGSAKLIAETEVVRPADRQRAETISARGHHAARIIQQSLTFNRRSPLERRGVELNALFTDLCKILRPEFPGDITIVVRTCEDRLPALADPAQLQQVITNLAFNARDAMPTGGSITVSLERRELKPGDPRPNREMADGPWAVVRVQDSGAGIAADVLPEVFEPFFTTKETGIGTGLGLSQVFSAIAQHGGHVEVQSPEGQGATFIISLPLDATALASGAPDAELAPVATLTPRTVLVVEDEDDVRALVADILGHLGYHTITASDGEEGLQLYREHRQRLPLVVTDKTMPKMGGIELAQALREEFPDVRVLILTGYLMQDRDADLRTNPAIFGWVQKPIEIEHLSKVVEAAFAAS